MKDIPTSGPMRIPARITGNSVGAFPDAVRISIVNPTTKTFRIQLFADVYDSSIGTVTTVPDVVHLIPDNSFLRRTFFFNAESGNSLRFFAMGDLDEDVEKLELSFVGQRTSDQIHEPTMLFRHEDLIEFENKHTHQDSISILATNHWGD